MFKVNYRKVYEDGSVEEWRRWSSRVYKTEEAAQAGITALRFNNRNWGFDLELVKMWQYDFCYVPHTVKVNK